MTTTRSTPTTPPRCWPAWNRRSCTACGSRPPPSTSSTATDGQARPPARLIGWTARFLGMVSPGDEIDFRVDRVGIDRGAEVLEVAARVGSDLVMSATARLAAPEDGVCVPGPGHPAQGHGHGGPRPVQGRPQGVGQRRQVHPRDAGLLGAARGAGQPDQHHRRRCALPASRGRAVPDAVHPGRHGDGRRRAGRRDARAGRLRRGRHRLRSLGRRVHRAGLRAPGSTSWRRCWRWCSTAAPRCTTSCRATSWAAPTTGWPRSGPRRSTCPTTTFPGSSPISPSVLVSFLRS